MSRYDDEEEEEEFDFGNEEDPDSEYEEDDLKNLDYQVDEVFESLIEDFSDEQLEDLYNRIGDHLSK
jgi:hypothetical protein